MTGATGGVGSLAIDIFSRAGFEVHAISGKPDHADYLRARRQRRSWRATRWRPRDRWKPRASAAAWTTSAAPMLASLLAQTAPYGNVASAGLAASPELDATVMPFIIRGVSLLGVASAGTARDIREAVWRRLATRLEARAPGRICTREIGLDGLPGVFDTHAGRWLVRADPGPNLTDRFCGRAARRYNPRNFRGTPWHAS